MLFIRPFLTLCNKMPRTRSKTAETSNLTSKYGFETKEKKKLKHSEDSNSSDKPLEEEQKEDTELQSSSESKSKKRGIKRKDAVKIKYEESGESDVKRDKWSPPNWEEVVNNIREMRKETVAPVDTMGCDVSHEPNISPEVRRYQILVSLMLSSQTKDEVNYAAMTRLKEHGLTIDNILRTDEDVIGKLIYPVGFWKTKAKNIKKATQMLKDDYGSDIPNSVETLCKLPGVGPKMAHLAINVGWGIVTGIGVDTHVHRISNRLGWVKKETKTPEATRVELESWLPKELWVEVNHLLVGFGQTKCRPINPECISCLNKSICPAAKKNISNKGKTKK